MVLLVRRDLFATCFPLDTFKSSINFLVAVMSNFAGLGTTLLPSIEWARFFFGFDPCVDSPVFLGGVTTVWTPSTIIRETLQYERFEL